MAKYRSLAAFGKKPVVIEAMQYNGRNAMEILAWAKLPEKIAEDFSAGLTIKTLEGERRADVSDWIIKGDKGECYACKPDFFAAIYELVNGGGP